MPINEYGMNDDFVKYFYIEEFIDKIKLVDSLLYHLEETSRDFDEYITLLSQYTDEEIINYLISISHQELRANQNIENYDLNTKLLENKGILFDSLNISNKRIHDLHNFVMESADESFIPSFTYRKTPVNISSIKKDGTEDVYWKGANPEDVNRFMTDFIKVYKQNKMSLVYSNPFLNSALMSLIFNRIHPYTDGNGRTSRIIYNLKFTEKINKNYQTRLMLCPLNISNRILANKKTYVDRINYIAFDLETDNNKAINNWFDFILTMADEQLYYSKQRINDLLKEKEPIISLDDEKTLKRVKKMKLSKLK